MKFFKKTLIAILTLLMLTSLAVAVGCDKTQNPPAPSGYSVTFMVEGEQYGETLTVQRGRRITAPADPTFTTAGYVFTGWYTDENFAEGTKWNFTTGIVTSDVTLYAGYRVVTAYVSDVAKAEEPVTSKLVWTQSAASDASNYEVILTSKSGSITLTGSVSYDAENTKVTFTPNTIPQGGVYTVSVRDNSKAEPACIVEDVLFCGEGTQANPYLIGSALDFNAVNRANVSANTYFQLAKNITIETSREAQKDYVFNGTLMGSGRTITLANSNSGAIYNLGAQGYVYNVNVAGSVSTALYDSVGAIVDFNAGRIEKVNTTANVESTAGLAGSNGLASALDATLADGAGSRGIAGGLVGTNLSTGVVYNCKISTSSSSTGTVKAAIAGGTIVGLNEGKIEMCVSNGCLGAWNSKETGKSTSNYSYGGGIAGINAGQILKCSVSGSGKIMAQRFTEDSQAAAAAGTNNANIGGIVGYNMKDATVSECYFAGVRVHGDENVGGIAGLNAGTISDVYVEGVNQSTNILVYIGGRTNIGGIVGKNESTGSVANAFVTANVFAYGANGVAYAVSEKANNSVYLSANPNTASSNDGNANPLPQT